MGIQKIINANEEKEKYLLKDEVIKNSHSTSRLEKLIAKHSEYKDFVDNNNLDIEGYSTKVVDLESTNGFVFLHESDFQEKLYLETLDSEEYLNFDDFEDNINSMSSEKMEKQILSQSEFEDKIKDILDCTNGITINLSNDGEIQQVTPKFER